MIHAMLWLLLFAPPNAAPAPSSKVQIYQEALRLTKQQRYQAATKQWERLVGIFQRELKKHPAHSRAHSQELMGQCHILYHLAETQWKANKKWAACRTRKRLEDQRKAIAPRWLRHASDASLAQVFLRSQKQLRTSCTTLPSKLKLQIKPRSATLRFQRGGQWHTAKGHVLEVLPGALTLAISAPGHHPQTHTISIPRWSQVARTFALVQAPATKPAPRRATPKVVVATRPPPPHRVARTRPPPTRPKALPTPFYRTWWFWTVTGLVVAGTTTAVLAATLATPPPGFGHPKDKPGQIPESTQ